MNINKQNENDLLDIMQVSRIGVPFEFEGEWYMAKATYAAQPCAVCAFRNNISGASKQCKVIAGCMPHTRRDHTGVVFRKTIKP